MKLICGNSIALLPEIIASVDNPVIVTDPPFNIGYKYRTYKDRLDEQEYYEMLFKVINGMKAVVIHYPEQLHKLSIKLGYAPEKIVSWVYNSNTAKQHRDIAFYNIKPDMKRVRQPYKNPNDKRIKERIANGNGGAKLYDWWNVNQVKNVSRDKTSHPCQMPIEVMENIVRLLPEGTTVIDPFMGSGTTGVACKKHGIDFVGIELDETYYEIANKRLEEKQ